MEESNELDSTCGVSDEELMKRFKKTSPPMIGRLCLSL